MGNRVSISFELDGEQSVVLFSHWDGMGLVRAAKKYVKLLDQEIAALPEIQKTCYPVHRKEPNTVMVDFICQYVAGGLRVSQSPRVTSNYYLAATENEGDNSDNGHFVIDLGTVDNKVVNGSSIKEAKMGVRHG
jgi:hypothetical protein